MENRWFWDPGIWDGIWVWDQAPLGPHRDPTGTPQGPHKDPTGTPQGPHSKGPQASKLQATNLYFSVLRAASNEHRVIECSSHRALELGGRGGSL